MISKMHIIKYQIYHKICIGHSEILKSSGLPPCKTAFAHPSVLKYLLCSHYVTVLSYTLGMDPFLIKFISFTFQLQFPLTLLLPAPHCNLPLPPSKQSFSVPVQKEPGLLSVSTKLVIPCRSKYKLLPLY